ncbi:MAG: 50S ribosomal protein L5 [Nitrospirales bacterium]|nr:50S ribosomal protein L5 [Nitrospirales bacterium]
MKSKSVAKEAVKAKEKPVGSTAVKPKDYVPRLKAMYHEKVIPAMMKEFGYKNPMQVPRVERIVLNIGMGEAVQNVKLLESAAAELEQIAGQKPVLTRSKKAIAGFKLREGIPIGAKVTLRGARMHEFLDRLVSVALPRIRDFRGISSKAFDGRGNYTLGLKEQLAFPEIKYDDVASIHGMDITFVTTAQRNDEAKSLLAHLGMPFRKP